MTAERAAPVRDGPASGVAREMAVILPGLFLPGFTCILQVIRARVPCVPRKAPSSRRSACPVSISLEMFGDRWSLLIIRDLMVRGLRTFKEFLLSGEGIASNILSDRLERLEARGIIATEADECDGRKVIYRLTEKGIDLAPVMLELLIWGARHEPTGASGAVIDGMENNREQVLAETKRRWRERDRTPLLPQFQDPAEPRRVDRGKRGHA